jgi:hypothetical protein
MFKYPYEFEIINILASNPGAIPNSLIELYSVFPPRAVQNSSVSSPSLNPVLTGAFGQRISPSFFE